LVVVGWLLAGHRGQIHEEIAAGVWDATPVETELLVQQTGSSAAAMPCW
jgi:hypothetical protein